MNQIAAKHPTELVACLRFIVAFEWLFLVEESGSRNFLPLDAGTFVEQS